MVITGWADLARMDRAKALRAELRRLRAVRQPADLDWVEREEWLSGHLAREAQLRAELRALNPKPQKKPEPKPQMPRKKKRNAGTDPGRGYGWQGNRGRVDNEA